jgi:hypothetical protein
MANKITPGFNKKIRCRLESQFERREGQEDEIDIQNDSNVHLKGDWNSQVECGSVNRDRRSCYGKGD